MFLYTVVTIHLKCKLIDQRRPVHLVSWLILKLNTTILLLILYNNGEFFTAKMPTSLISEKAIC